MVTQKQKEVLELLPATRIEIGNELGISRRAVRYRMDRLEDEHGYNFSRDSDGIWYREDGEYPNDYIERDDTDPWRVSSYEKAQITRKTNEELTDMEVEVKDALSKINPVVSEVDRKPGTSTLVIPHSDSHVGSIINSRDGVDYYSADEAKDAIGSYFNRCINSALDRGDVDDVVLIMNGDHLDGEGVYAAQRHEQEDNLRDQLRKAGSIYIEEILKLSRNFVSVDVYCVPGNHGDISKRSTTNADMMLYDFVETGVNYSGADNVNITKAGPGGFLNPEIRGWTYHLRHGQDYLEHVGTSSGIRRALDWYSKYDFDVGIRSHYHTVKYETIGDEIPIIMTGSPSPPSTFAESKGADGGECGVYWFCTDESPVEEFQPIRI